MLAALAAGGACSVYGPDDLPGLVSGGSSSGGGKGGVTGATGGTGGGGRGSGGSGEGGLAAGGSGGTLGSSGSAGDGGEGEAAGAESGGKAGNSSGGSVSEAGRGGAAGNGAGGTSGGTSAVGGKASGGTSSGGATPTVPPELIDDMEDQDDQILIHESRDGYWYTSVDTAGSSVEPPPSTKIVMTDLASGDTGAGGGSTRFFHFSGKSLGTNVSGAWGALGGFDLMRVSGGLKQPYDAHIYKGIRFWAKSNPANTPIRLRVPLRDTTAGTMGSKCTPNTGGPVTTTSCDDFHFKAITLAGSWTRYDVVWSDFVQIGFGYQVKPLDPATLVSVQFLIQQGSSGEISIDDVSFIP